MQNDTDGNMAVDQPEEDQDSLFGSPPSSPIRGRSPSPALALPGAGKSAQNVGTIALPGSHHYSELPVTPLALSLSNALNELPLRPPAPAAAVRQPSAHTPSSASPSWSRASSAGPSFKPKKKPSKKAKSKESTPRPPPPEIPFPDPSGPVPANFLRNQSALLGTAGLVGGVNPAYLSTHRHTRGTNSSNPIVVEDEEEPPTLGRPSKFRQPYSKPVDPSLLPTPSTQDVVAMLIGQKDIFPVLESLLRLIAAGSGPQAPTPAPTSAFRKAPQSSTQDPATGPTSSFSSGPPPKKRKLNRVPAGAADWDVPYPFPPGQGPDSYRTNWERERGKQLISQLVTLIKSAARKAATRIYYQHEHAKKQMMDSQRAVYAQMQESSSSISTAEPKVHGHYRPSTVTYGLEGEAAAAAKAQAQEVLTDASNGRAKAVVAHAPSPYQPVQPSSVAPALEAQPSTPFDQLISSLLAATPNQDASSTTSSSFMSNSVAADSVSHLTADATASSSSSGKASPLDQGLFDNWMNILQTFPMPSEGFSQSQNQGGHPEQPNQFTSASTDDDFNFFDFDQSYTESNHVDPASFDVEAMFSSTDATTATSSTTGSTLSEAQPGPSTSHDSTMASLSQPQLDFAIDPALLALSIPQPSLPGNAFTTTSDISPSLTGSPIPSMSSFGDADPTTPNSATWDLSMPEVFTASSGDASAVDNGLITGGRVADQGGADEYMNDLFGAQSQVQGKDDDAGRVEEGKGTDTCDLAGRQRPTTIQPEVVHASPPLPPPVTILTPAVTPKAIEKSASKSDIMKRAAVRKRQLMAEIDSVRTQLWETTIEQGVLSHMSKLCSHTT
ncbi:hypothetical protein FPV67DRAFT_1483272 [Lyophyllum atratum]|nr:hypothetical protein FPV67DRAFT_1483272 [Lyophyllum atratum]